LNPSVSGQELNKMIGKSWKELNDEKRKEYEQLAEKDKLRWMKEKEQYDSTAKVKENVVDIPNTSKDQQNISKYFKVENNKNETVQKKKKKIIVKVKQEESDYYERFKLKDRTIEELVKKIQEKYPEEGELQSIVNIPNVVVRDTEGVKCLSHDAELVVTFRRV